MKKLSQIIVLFLIIVLVMGNMSVYAVENITNPEVKTEETAQTEITEENNEQTETTENINSDKSEETSKSTEKPTETQEKSTEKPVETTEKPAEQAEGKNNSVEEKPVELKIKSIDEHQYKIIQLVSIKENESTEVLSWNEGFIQDKDDSLEVEDFVDEFEKLNKIEDEEEFKDKINTFIEENEKYFNTKDEEKALKPVDNDIYEVTNGIYYIFDDDEFYEPQLIKIEKNTEIELKQLPEEENTEETAAEKTEKVSDENKEDKTENKTEESSIDDNKITLTQKVDDVEITVKAEKGVLPEDATLSAKKVEKEHDLKKIEKAIDEERNIAGSFTYDIKILDKDGNEIQPEKPVEILFSSPLINSTNHETNVYHIKEKGIFNTFKAEKLENTSEENFVAETDGFSYYTVEFTYNDLIYTMQGDTEIPLSTVLDYVGLTGTVSKVEGSNNKLFSFEKKNDVWYVKANKAFQTDEWMKVTIDGIEYEIIVTDAISYIVTFNPNGGTVSTASVTVAENSSIGTLPTPTRTGFTFDGWYTTATGGTKLTTSYKPTANIMVFAHWTYTKSLSYTGSYQTWTAPVSGTYQITIYGAAGGDADGTLGIGYGGDGGYSVGRKEFASSDNLYIAIGGQGTDAGQEHTAHASGGWNGGGQGGIGSKLVTNYCDGGGGGGATSVCTKLRSDGQLKNYSSYTSEVLMVAGGGGGGARGSDSYAGGNGGGASPGTGTGASSAKFTNGTFGQGTNVTKTKSSGITDSRAGNGGGGGGYTGGRASNSTGNRSNASGGGGTGYVSSTLTDASTSTSTHTGNGSFSITLLSSNYDITFNPNGGSSNTLYQNITPGNTCTLPTPTKTGCTFLGWYTSSTGGTKRGDGGATYTPSQTETLYAHWQNPSYNVTATAVTRTSSGSTVSTTGGTVTGSNSYEGETSATLTATANNGYIFEGWATSTTATNYVSTDSSYTFTVEGETNYYAIFAQEIIITASAVTRTSSGSTVSTTGGTVTGGKAYGIGTSATLKANAKAGYTFKGWATSTTATNYVSTNATYTFTVTNAGTYYAIFEQNPSYNVTATAVTRTVSGSTVSTTGGTVTGSNSYIGGTSATITATANSGYGFLGWTTSPTATTYISTTPSYTFTVTGATTYYAIFSQGHIHDNHTFTEWTSTTSLPTTAGNYYLAHDVTISSTQSIRSTDVCLCLNGHTITATNIPSSSPAAISVSNNATFSLFDCQGDGCIVTQDQQTIAINGQDGTTVNIYGGEIQDFHVGLSTYNLNMYGGKIKGCSAPLQGGEAPLNIYGGEICYNEGNITCESSINLYGGHIYNNVAGYNHGMIYGSYAKKKKPIINVGGSPVIENNYKTGTITKTGNNYSISDTNTKININLSSSAGDYATNIINVTNTLDSTAKIGVTKEVDTDFTSGLNGKGNTSNFTSDNEQYSVVLSNNNEARLSTALNMTVTPTNYSGVYDGNAHKAKIKVNTAGTTISYGTSTSYGNTLTATNANTDYEFTEITRTNVGTTTIYYKVEKSGYVTVTGSTTITIAKANNPLSYASTQSVSKTFSTSSQTATLTAATNAQGTLSYAINSQKTSGGTTVNYFSLSGTTLTIGANTPAGTYTVIVRATAAGNDNYNSGTKDSTVTVTVSKANMTVTATPYNEKYDGSAHSAKIKVNVSGAKVDYGTDTDYGYSITSTTANTDHIMSSVSLTNNGQKVVFYKVSKANYNDVIGSTTININPKFDEKTVTVVTDGKHENRIPITAAQGGSNFNYTKISGSFTIEDKYLVVPANTAPGTYTTVIRATDISNRGDIPYTDATYTTNVVGSTMYAEFDSANGKLRIFRDDESLYSNEQRVGTKTYYRDIESITGTNRPAWYNHRSNIISVEFEDEFSPKTAYRMFYECSNLTSITGLDNFDTAAVTNMESMFSECRSLTSLDLSGFDTGNVTDMSDMFERCSGLTSLDVSGFDLSSTTDIRDMFEGCSNLETLNISGFAVSSGTSTTGIFTDCNSLRNIALGPNTVISRNAPNTNWLQYKALDNTPIANGARINNLSNYDGSKPGWYKSQYTITYNANGGSNPPAAQYKDHGVNVTLSSDSPEKTGYEHAGWATSQIRANAGTIDYAKGAVYSEDANITLYAIWTGNTATLTYNANGHGTAPEPVTMKYEEETKAASAITATGWNFIGWNTKQDGSGTAYAPNDVVKAANVEPANTILYAQWEIVPPVPTGTRNTKGLIIIGFAIIVLLLITLKQKTKK